MGTTEAAANCMRRADFGDMAQRRTHALQELEPRQHTVGQQLQVRPPGVERVAGDQAVNPAERVIGNDDDPACRRHLFQLGSRQVVLDAQAHQRLASELAGTGIEIEATSHDFHPGNTRNAADVGSRPARQLPRFPQ